MKKYYLLLLVTFSTAVISNKDVNEMTDLEKCSVIADGYALMYQNHIDGWTVEDQKTFFDNVLAKDGDLESLERLKRQAETIYMLPVPKGKDAQKREKINLYIRESANCLYDFSRN